VDELSPFLALKAQLAVTPPDRYPHLHWEQVLAVNDASFSDYPQIRDEYVAALENLEGTDYGQQWLRELLLTPHRNAPLVIETGRTPIASSLAYIPATDRLVVDPHRLEDPMTRAAMEAEGLTYPEVILLHEGDHAIRLTLGDNEFTHSQLAVLRLPPDASQDEISRAHHWKNEVLGCVERMAMDRELPFRLENGLAPRERYVNMTQQYRAMLENPDVRASVAAGLHDPVLAERLRSALHDFALNAAVLNNGCETMTLEEADVAADALTDEAIQVLVDVGLIESVGALHALAQQGRETLAAPSVPADVPLRGTAVPGR
jgi:hypothetical protein